jgi:hypothetical protein
MMSLRSAHKLSKQEGRVERLAVGTENDLLGSSESNSVEALQYGAALCRPHGFPKLQRPKDTPLLDYNRLSGAAKIVIDNARSSAAG